MINLDDLERRANEERMMRGQWTYGKDMKVYKELLAAIPLLIARIRELEEHCYGRDEYAV